MEPILKTTCECNIYSEKLQGPDIFEVSAICSKAKDAKVELHNDRLLITGKDILGEGVARLEVPFSSVLYTSLTTKLNLLVLRKEVLYISFASGFHRGPWREASIWLTQTGFSFGKMEAIYWALRRHAPDIGSREYGAICRNVKEDAKMLRKLKVVSAPK